MIGMISIIQKLNTTHIGWNMWDIMKFTGSYSERIN